MDESYHVNNSLSSGGYPDIVTGESRPAAYARLCDELRRLAEQLDTPMLQIGHRKLAAAIGCSASRIPTLMQRMEDAGQIVRHAWKNGFVIDVTPLIDHPARADRETAAPLIDQPPVDPVAAQPNAPDRHDSRDRVKTSCMDDHDSKTQEKEIAQPLFDRLMAQPGMSRSLATRIAAHPIGALTDFLHDLRLAQSIAAIHSPFFFTVAKWRDGQRVIAPEERPHEHARSATASGARRQPRTNRPERTADPALTPDAIAALVAEWERTEPLGPVAVRVPGQRGGAYGD